MLVEEDVLGLDISVDDVLAVEILHGLEGLEKDLLLLREGKLFFFLVVEESAIFGILHDEVELVVFLEDVEESDEMLVRELLHEFDLSESESDVGRRNFLGGDVDLVSKPL